jgi:CheY-like chemotaxis protein
MGGQIGVDAAPPLFGETGGSCFWFTLPNKAIAPAENDKPLAGMRVAVMSHNPALREGLYLQVAMAGGIPANSKSHADAILIDAGTGNVPELAVQPDPAVPAVVLLTPNARGGLPEMRAIGFVSYLVKPVRQATLVSRLALCRAGAAALAAESAPPMIASIGPLAGRPLPISPPEKQAPDFAQPALPPSLHEERPIARAARPVLSTPGHAMPSGDGLNILLAEDNPINMMLSRELLRRRGHRVTEVTTGNDAVKAMAKDDFDLLLTDIHMPGMDGVEATQAIRAAEALNNRRRTPIVALTADALEDGRRACLEAGMDGFLTKPVDPVELEEMFLMLFPDEEGSHIVAA